MAAAKAKPVVIPVFLNPEEAQDWIAQHYGTSQFDRRNGLFNTGTDGWQDWQLCLPEVVKRLKRNCSKEEIASCKRMQLWRRAQEAIDNREGFVFELATEHNQMFDNVSHMTWFQKAVANHLIDNVKKWSGVFPF